ncbi:type IV secretory system conjugative DNA transfer family protein [Nocardia sp. NPDC060249]|uniref:type IV secretory system conjugative DNA transfer family protein n=1 Tax=Nocardia sp. NPDC060249 TaxID=3347082 RepID=UPI0036515FF4
MTARSTRPSPIPSEVILGVGAAALALVVGLVVVAYRLGGGDLPGWSPTLLMELAAGRGTWPMTATAALMIELIAVTAVAVGIARILAGRRGPQREVDVLAKTMTDPATVQILDPKWSTEEAARLAPGIDAAHPSYRGVPMGVTVRRNLPVFLPWEWVVVALAGTRMGKTAALAIPAACAAPGALIATSNKPDLYTHTRGIREQMGTCWLFDLQGVTTGEIGQASFWWNPLKPIHDLPSAKKVAAYFVGASREDGAKVDSYFDGSAKDLLAVYMLAAALGGGDLVHAIEWMASEQDTMAAHILQIHGEDAAGRTLTTKQGVTERQRDGFFDMARRFLETLDAQRYAKAILPNERVIIGVGADGKLSVRPGKKIHDLPEFDPVSFALGHDTLYALSREGPDSATALNTALVGQVLDQAEAAGARTKHGRLPVPLVAVLDEAANVCRLQSLPDQYSHFGSRGILPITILQSPSQGESVWGKVKFQIMLDACNGIWYGGNITDREFLDNISNLVGEHVVRHDSTSTPTGWFSGGSASRSSSWQNERILTPDKLAAMPSDRALMMLPSSKPLLLRKSYWSQGPFAEQIRASIDDHGADEAAAGAAVEMTKETE